MIIAVLLSLFTLNHGTDSEEDSDEGIICSTEYNPVCCPDPNDYELAVHEYREYWNVCEFSYGKDNKGNDKNPILCGYGTCPVCMCSLIYNPICCNNIEYTNECDAECKGIDIDTCDIGKCVKRCDCTSEYRPICCPKLNNTEFANPCLAECDGLSTEDLIACNFGTCKRPEDICTCPSIYDPVCCDEQDFATQCVANCVLGEEKAQICKPRECKKCDCTADYQPVCCDTTTYGNSCMASCDKTDAELLHCRYRECPSCLCDMPYKPLCCNGIEYGNQCEADCGKATNCIDGPCKSSYDSVDDDHDKHHRPNNYNDNNNKAAFKELSVRDCLCKLDYNPVCCQSDSDDDNDKGTTYGNQCEADCDGAKQCVSGECESSLCLCSMEYNPVCCEGDGDEPDEQFSNGCTAECAKTKQELIHCQYKACDSMCGCSMDYKPTCCDGIQYDNLCSAKCAGKTDCIQDECPKICPLIYDAVCCDGKEYASLCNAEAAGVVINCKSGTCKNECKCIFEYIPVCCGETTYGNQCNAECAGEDLVRCEYGECEDEIQCDCKKDKEKPVCCNGKDEFRNICIAKCAGENKKHCVEKECDDLMELYGAGMNGMSVGVYQYEFNINTVILGLILISILGFGHLYYRKLKAVHFEKQIEYDSDQ